MSKGDELGGPDVAEELFELFVLPPEPLVLLLDLVDAGHLSQQELSLLLNNHFSNIFTKFILNKCLSTTKNSPQRNSTVVEFVYPKNVPSI